jgi:hypothetical protein
VPSPDVDDAEDGFCAANCHAGIEALLVKKLIAPLSSALGAELAGAAGCEGDDEAYAAFHGAAEAGPAGDPGAPGPGARRLSSRLLRDLISD